MKLIISIMISVRRLIMGDIPIKTVVSFSCSAEISNKITPKIGGISFAYLDLAAQRSERDEGGSPSVHCLSVLNSPPSPSTSRLREAEMQKNGEFFFFLKTKIGELEMQGN